MKTLKILKENWLNPKTNGILFRSWNPKKWKKYIKQGIEDWQAAFEEAGFKNAIIAKDPPTKEEDPDWSPEDIRYSVVRYLASS